MPTQEEKTHGMLCWLLAIVIPVISPIIFMLIAKEKPFVYANAMQCLTMNLVWYIGGSILAAVTCGIGGIVLIVPLIFNIMGGVAANNGTVYEPPITGQLAKNWFHI
jgi:uncharacterized membrane protein